jgi:hypothetical protein
MRFFASEKKVVGGMGVCGVYARLLGNGVWARVEHFNLISPFFTLCMTVDGSCAVYDMTK